MECDSVNVISLAAKVITMVGGLVAAFWAIYVYRRNSRVRHAEWLLSLYEKFYEKSELRKIREILDCANGDSHQVAELVRSGRRDYTDYLNFFEFVAVLHKSNQLTGEEIEDLFCYYLNCLEKWRDVRDYIADKTNGYEQLDRLLRERAGKK